MKVLLVGGGGREHALAWKISQSPSLHKLYTAPGNAGTAELGENVSISDTDIPKLTEFAYEEGIDLTIIGPEAPLAAGIVDKFKESGLHAFGPNKRAAQLESSKTFAKNFMVEMGIPTANSITVFSAEEARTEVDRFGLPVVIKADGLAAGKGVYICESQDQAARAIEDLLTKRKFGDAGNKVVIEEFLTGPEISVFAFSDGSSVSPLVGACDYKRIGDDDKGPNTGGMGAYSPAVFWDSQLENKIRAEVMEKVIRGMKRTHNSYVGVLFAGLILTDNGPKVLEFNCRFGDPETQVILPLLNGDILDICKSCVDGTLENATFGWENSSCVAVVIASGGYPNEYSTGFPIAGLETVDRGSILFHAGTKISEDGNIETTGGRVLSVSSKGQSVKDARENSYRNVAKIKFQNSYFRSDIASVEQGD